MADDWRRICEEIIAAGEKAQPRPYTDRAIPQDANGDGVFYSYEASIEGKEHDPRTTTYAILSANNADRLAHFVMALADELHWPNAVGLKDWLNRAWRDAGLEAGDAIAGGRTEDDGAGDAEGETPEGDPGV